MTIASTILNKFVSMNDINNVLINGGANPLITKKQFLSMRNFIRILLKLFRKDYNSKINRSSRSSRSSGGGYGDYANAFYISDLNYSNSYKFPLNSTLERSFV